MRSPASRLRRLPAAPGTTPRRGPEEGSASVRSSLKVRLQNDGSQIDWFPILLSARHSVRSGLKVFGSRARNNKVIIVRSRWRDDCLLESKSDHQLFCYFLRVGVNDFETAVVGCWGSCNNNVSVDAKCPFGDASIPN